MEESSDVFEEPEPQVEPPDEPQAEPREEEQEKPPVDPLGLTPREIVEELNRYIIGQTEAKKMVAIALRNRSRRRSLTADLRDEVHPKNILMIGPTGVGKTEIARRLARLAGAPFLKVEATKYTEVGYVGRDVESMIRDLVEVSVTMLREERRMEVLGHARQRADNRLLDILFPLQMPRGRSLAPSEEEENIAASDNWRTESGESLSFRERRARTREKLRTQLEQGLLDDRTVEIELRKSSHPVIGGMMIGNPAEMEVDLRNMMDRLVPQQPRNVEMSVADAREVMTDEEVENLLDMDKIVREALKVAEESGIVFIDELDKVAGRHAGAGPDVSREGVQRDILPIIEGSTVFTKYGSVSSEHILFIAAGAFHMTKPADLIPELQGRFPLRVQLDALTVEDFKRILTDPENALTRQYKALLQTEGVTVEFTEDGINEVAQTAFGINSRSENIGARRLYTVMEKVTENLSFEASDLSGTNVTIDAEYVRTHLGDIIKDADLSKFIL